MNYVRDIVVRSARVRRLLVCVSSAAAFFLTTAFALQPSARGEPMNLQLHAHEYSPQGNVRVTLDRGDESFLRNANQLWADGNFNMEYRSEYGHSPYISHIYPAFNNVQFQLNGGLGSDWPVDDAPPPESDLGTMNGNLHGQIRSFQDDFSPLIHSATPGTPIFFDATQWYIELDGGNIDLNLQGPPHEHRHINIGELPEEDRYLRGVGQGSLILEEMFRDENENQIHYAVTFILPFEGEIDLHGITDGAFESIRFEGSLVGVNGMLVVPIPEPTGGALALFGVVALTALRRRRLHF